MSEQSAAPDGRPARLLALYDRAVADVYGYLLSRSGQRATAEDLTAETFLAAADALRADAAAPLSVPWLMGVARHKLADHWRGQARAERLLRVAAGQAGARPLDDPWDERLDALAARTALAGLAPQHRAALTLRYMDDLPVPQVAELLGRTVHATEALLVRARVAFRAAYRHEEGEDGDD